MRTADSLTKGENDMPIIDEEAVSTLNDLIETCKDGEKGFSQASENVKDPQLKSLFTQYSQQRSDFVSELQMEVERLGGQPETTGSAAGATHRGWLNVKSAVTGHSADSIIAECERGEDAAVSSYQEALSRNLPPDVRNLVERQYGQIKQAHDRIRALEKATSRQK
jgi:uncharacterized protein (TIGR02284 family)